MDHKNDNNDLNVIESLIDKDLRIVDFIPFYRNNRYSFHDNRKFRKHSVVIIYKTQLGNWKKMRFNLKPEIQFICDIVKWYLT